METTETTKEMHGGTAHLCDWCDAPHSHRGHDETAAPYRACAAHYRQWIAPHAAAPAVQVLANGKPCGLVVQGGKIFGGTLIG